MEIIKKLIKYNFSDRKGEQIKYIVIHDTGNKSVGANAEAHYKYFSGGNRNASAHYFVDDKQVIQIIEDEKASWHVGDGAGKFGITNSNSIGIEICVNQDGNYEKAFDNAVQLTKELMKKYNIPVDRVVRHFDASRKVCPASMYPNDWLKWRQFREELIKPEIPKWDVLKLGSKGDQVKALQTQLNKFGYKLVVDGIFGNATNKAVKDFQKKKGLVVDGIVGKQTRKALFS